MGKVHLNILLQKVLHLFKDINQWKFTLLQFVMKVSANLEIKLLRIVYLGKIK